MASDRQLHQAARFTRSQRALLASHALGSDAPVQTMAHLLTFGGAIDAARLAAAFDQVVVESDVLRTKVNASVEGLALSLWPHAPAPTAVISIARADVQAWAEARAATSLDLTDSAYDSAVLDHGDGEVSWYLAFDHLVTDAASSALVVQATSDVYAGSPIELASYYSDSDTRYDPADTASAARPANGATDSSDPDSAGALGRLYEQSDGTTAASSRVTAVCETALAESIERALSGPLQVMNRDLSLTSLLLTATSIYLFGLTGERSFTLGMPVGQRSEATRSIIGPFMEPWPVPVSIDPAATVGELHKRVTRSMFNTLKQAHRNQSSNVGFDVVVNVIPHSAPLTFDGHAVSMAWIPPTAIDPSHLLRVQLTGYDQSDGDRASFGVDLDINHSAANQQHRHRAPGHFKAALTSLLGDLDRPVASLALVDESEHATLRSWEIGSEASADATPLADRLRASLEEVSHTVLGDFGANYSGDELWAWAQSVARYVSERSEIGDRVTVELDPSACAVAAIYGVVLAGRSFVPIDPAMPRARRDQLADLAQAHLRFDQCTEIDELRNAERLHNPVIADVSDEAYLLFTSGSTGAPKGVPISHRGLLDYLDFATGAYFDTRQPPVAPLFSSLGFDLTLTTLFGPILAGGRIEIVGSGPAALPEIARRPDITWIKATPSHLEVLLRLLPPEHTLEVAVVGGEAFPSALAAKLVAGQPSMKIFNEYGPTEAVVGCMIHRATPHEFTEGPDIPIGRPAPGVELRVASEDGTRVPIGGIGELLIAHRGLTTGYLTDPGADLPSPFVDLDGVRFYRSGDLVRLRDDFRLEYHGRVDAQIKVGGRRLDPLEVEEALERHPSITRAAVRLWSPVEAPIQHRCERCGLADNVPGTIFDDAGVCSTCLAFEEVSTVANDYFGEPDELQALLQPTADSPARDYDCLHLLSGGKDSTFALYKLVELGLKPYVLTLDNGFISDGAKDNVRQTVADLGLDHEFATASTMNEIFRESLAEHSNVCNGCYKAIYTLATNRAAELAIPAIVTGLSRGQLFETRLVPAQFSGESDPAAIDRAVLRARMHYHRTPDRVNQLLDTDVFADDELFSKIRYVDFYRYVDVELAEMLAYLDEHSPWVRPKDTGRSTNCLINIAGIHTHRQERGFHSYAVPYAWDVRLGHKTRDESIAELEDDPELDQVSLLLGEVGYVPRARQVLTAWVEIRPTAVTPSPIELRAFLADHVPAWAVPSAIVEVETWPTNQNGKLDSDRLPAPTRVHRSGATMVIEASNDLESSILRVWERQLGLEPIGIDDDFFALGGDSLAALNAISQLSLEMGTSLPDEFAFMHTTPRELAAAITSAGLSEQPVTLTKRAASSDVIPQRPDGAPPALSSGEASVLFEQRARPDAVMYNLGRRYRLPNAVAGELLGEHLALVAAAEQTLSWTYGSERTAIPEADRVRIQVVEDAVSEAESNRRAQAMHRQPFDLSTGPFLRGLIQQIDDGSTDLTIVIHHATGDRTSLDALFDRVQRSVQGREIDDEPFDYGDYWAWKSSNLDTEHSFWMTELDSPRSLVALQLPAPSASGENDADGLLTTIADTTPAALQALRGTTAVAAIVAAAASTMAPYFEHGMTELCLLATSRTHAQTANQFGYYLNPLPLRVHADAPNRDVLAETSAQLGRRLPHRAYPFAQLVSACRDAGLNVPESRILVAWDDGTAPTYLGRPVRAEAMFNGTAVADLTFFAEVVGADLRLSLEYSGATVGELLAARLLDQFDGAITNLVAQGSTPDTNQHTKQVAVLVGPEQTSVHSVRQQFRQHLDDRPLDVAVVCGEQQLDWATLAHRVNHLAIILEQRGIGPNSRVIVELSRTTNLIVALLAIMQRGASYVPIDPSYPRAQRAAVHVAAQAALRLCEPGANAASAGASIELGENGIDGNGWGPTTGVDLAAWPEINDADEAYVIFTSGSTGVPRGVAVTHGQINASTSARDGFYEDTPESFVVPSSSAFDSSIVGLFWTLAQGGTVVLPTEAEVHDIDALVALLARTNPSYLLCVPSLYRALLRRATPGQGWPSHVIVAGESCDLDVIAAHQAGFPESTLTNEYGPTECTVWATAHHCSGAERSAVPIGTPIAGTFAAVVDDELQLCRPGERGQLVLGGACTTAGYINDPTQTAARFLSSLPQSGSVLPQGPVFLTGDAAVIEGGSVYFHGRLDDQLNVGGRRVEPGEIESALRSCPGVRDVVVVATDLRSTDQLLLDASSHDVASVLRHSAEAENPIVALRDGLAGHGTRQLGLVALVEAEDSLDTAQLHEHARDELPRLLRPTRVEIVSELPHTANGKIDRRAAQDIATTALISAQGTTPTGASVPHEAGDSDEIVSTLCSLFAKVLRVDRVEPTTSFFDAGGDSLLTLDLLAAVERSLGVSLSTSVLFTEGSPLALAQHILTSTPGARPVADRGLVIPIETAGTRPPIFAINNLGTNAEYFRPLADALGSNQPFYGLGAAHQLELYGLVDYDPDRAVSVEGIAATCVGNIEEIAPTGPVVVTGLCGGAIHAYEVAQQLRSRGREVGAFVVINDWQAPHLENRTLSHSTRENWARRWDHLRTLRGEYVAIALGPVKRRLEQLEVDMLGRMNRPLGHRLRVRQYIEESLASMDAYEYAPYPGRVVVIRGENDPRLVGQEEAGWGDLFTDVSFHTVTALGLDVLTSAAVTQTAAVFTSAVDEVIDSL